MSAAQTTEIATIDIADKPIIFRPFMGKKEITLTANMVYKLLAKPTKTGKMPTIIQCIKFAKLCEARALDPWEGDAYLVGYDTSGGPEFNLITAHQAFLKRAETHPKFDGMESGVVVADANDALSDQPGDFLANDQTLAGGWARVHFKNRKIPTYRRLNLKTFSTGRSRWEKDPAGMIVKCAEADVLRSSFPTSLGGMYLREEFDANIDESPRQPVPMPRAIGVTSTIRQEQPKPDPDSQIDPAADASQESQVEDNGAPPQRQESPAPEQEMSGAGEGIKQPEPALTFDADSIEAQIIKACQQRIPDRIAEMLGSVETAKKYILTQIKLKAKKGNWAGATVREKSDIIDDFNAGTWPKWPDPDAV